MNKKEIMNAYKLGYDTAWYTVTRYIKSIENDVTMDELISLINKYHNSYPGIDSMDRLLKCINSYMANIRIKLD